MRTRALSIACAGLLALAGGAAPSACAADAPEQVFELTIRGGAVPATQRLIKVRKDDALRWRITSDSAGELHVHGYRLEAKLAAGAASELAFKAFATGRYRLEWHPAGANATPAGAHHGAPLATLEVRPR
jgi:hypothetical protein